MLARASGWGGEGAVWLWLYRRAPKAEKFLPNIFLAFTCCEAVPQVTEDDGRLCVDDARSSQYFSKNIQRPSEKCEKF